jgi:hypothetical protein
LMTSTELDEAVGKIKGSRSWKVTAPVRNLKFWRPR